MIQIEKESRVRCTRDVRLLWSTPEIKIYINIERKKSLIRTGNGALQVFSNNDCEKK